MYRKAISFVFVSLLLRSKERYKKKNAAFPPPSPIMSPQTRLHLGVIIYCVLEKCREASPPSAACVYLEYLSSFYMPSQP